jgi:Tol biopolymer transport system component
VTRVWLAVLLAVLGVAGTAHATFPGGNGRIAYTWSRGGEDFEAGPAPRLVGVVSVLPNGAGRRLVARRGREPAYSPNGRRIAFLRSHRLWVAAAAGGDPRRVTPTRWLIGQHRWSPRGTRLAFERGFRGSVSSALYAVRPDGIGLHRLLKAPMPITLTAGAWSPRGRGIVYAQSTAGGSLVRVFRGGRITTVARPGSAPTWSAHGQIAYEAPVAGGGRSQVCVTRFGSAAAPRCIAFAGASISNPTWSPDGGRLMVLHTHQGQGVREVWTLRPDGTVLTRLAAAGSSLPIFSPNGRLLAYSETRFAGDPRLGYTDLFVQMPDGTGKRRLVRGGQAESPDWQPVARGPLR